MNSQPDQKQYRLKWNPRPHLIKRYAIICTVLCAASIVLSWLAVLTVPGGFLGVGALYFASIFYAVITYWFGGWGLIASFVGAFVGSGLLTGMPILIALPFAAADIIEPLLPFVFLRSVAAIFDIDPLARNVIASPKRLVVFIPVCAILPPFISGLWGSYVLLWAGFVPPKAFWAAVLSWWVGAALLLAFFVPAICKALGTFVVKRGLACEGFWS